MKRSEIKVGGYYRAVVNGGLTTVRVDRINKEKEPVQGTNRTRLTGRQSYEVTNLETDRRVVFQSLAAFRGPAVSNKEQELRTDRTGQLLTEGLKEDEQGSDPTQSDMFEQQTPGGRRQQTDTQNTSGNTKPEALISTEDSAMATISTSSPDAADAGPVEQPETPLARQLRESIRIENRKRVLGIITELADTWAYPRR